MRKVINNIELEEKTAIFLFNGVAYKLTRKYYEDLMHELCLRLEDKKVDY